MRHKVLRCSNFVATLLILFIFEQAHAQSSCAATNDVGNKVCSISCPVGQAATCLNGDGADAPTCVCSAAQNFVQELTKATVVTSALTGSTLECLKVYQAGGLHFLNTCAENIQVVAFWVPASGNSVSLTYRLGGYRSRPVLTRGEMAIQTVSKEVKEGTQPDAMAVVRPVREPNGYWYVQNNSSHYVWVNYGTQPDQRTINSRQGLLFSPTSSTMVEPFTNGWHLQLNSAEYEPD